MKDTKLEELTIQELFYLKDEWNEAYKEKVDEFKDLELMYEALNHEFGNRGINFEQPQPQEEDIDDTKHTNTIH